MSLHMLGSACLVGVAIYSSCGQHAITLRYREVDDYAFSRTDLRTIQAIADAATREVRPLLPALPVALVLEVFPAEDVIDDLGYRGEEMDRFVYFGVDPHHGEGVGAIAEAHLRPFLFSAFYRLVRSQSVDWSSVLDHAVGAGLTTVFARDYADTIYPWTDYPLGVDGWVAELMALPDDAPFDRWMRQHPDGRRWVGIRAGTYLVDQAIQSSGKSAVDLVSTPTEAIVSMARSTESASGR